MFKRPTQLYPFQTDSNISFPYEKAKLLRKDSLKEHAFWTQKNGYACDNAFLLRPASVVIETKYFFLSLARTLSRVHETF